MKIKSKLDFNNIKTNFHEDLMKIVPYTFLSCSLAKVYALTDE